MAVPGPGGRRRSLWQWSPGGYHLIRLEAVPFTAGSVPDLLAAFQIGATFADIRVVSLAGGEARVLLSARGGGVEVLAGSPPGLAFKHHDTGGSGTWVVWQWDADLGQLVRADGSFTAFYRQQAAGVPLKPAGAAWVDYYAAITYLRRGRTRTRRGWPSRASTAWATCTTAPRSWSWRPPSAAARATVPRPCPCIKRW